MAPSSETTPLTAIVNGLVAGAVGTAAMTAAQEASAGLMSSGEQNGSQSQPSDPWEQASTPAKVGKRILEGIFHQQVSEDQIPRLTNIMHWAYGTSWGAAYGVLAGSLRHRRPVRRGLLFGTAVWLMSYFELVPMGLYEPPWSYPPQQLGLELGYHLVYGAGAALGYTALERL